VGFEPPPFFSFVIPTFFSLFSLVVALLARAYASGSSPLPFRGRRYLFFFRKPFFLFRKLFPLFCSEAFPILLRSFSLEAAQTAPVAIFPFFRARSLSPFFSLFSFLEQLPFRETGFLFSHSCGCFSLPVWARTQSPSPSVRWLGCPAPPVFFLFSPFFSVQNDFAAKSAYFPISSCETLTFFKSFFPLPQQKSHVAFSSGRRQRELLLSFAGTAEFRPSSSPSHAICPPFLVREVFHPSLLPFSFLFELGVLLVAFPPFLLFFFLPFR